MTTRTRLPVAILATAAVFAACGDSEDPGASGVAGSGTDASMGGSAGMAGSSGAGGTSNGGTAGSSGNGGSAGVGGSAGGTGTGGTAGSSGNGGSAGVGGSSGAGGTGTGGTAGSSGNGGSAGVGGSSGAGGNSGGTGNGGTAGSSGTGGNAGAGGVSGAGGGAGTGGSAGAGGAAGAGGSECAGVQPAKLVPMTGGYSIDETEVTRCQYKAWLDTNPPTTGQSPQCSWNSSFTPPLEWPPGAKGDHPVVYVDWCDAHAYCKGVGKRLCGKIGGGPTPWGILTDASTSEWFNACSSGGVNLYPYGITYSGTSCNGFDAGNGGTVEVGSLSSCETASGVLDLSGNVWEWEDSCQFAQNATDPCRLRGGSFLVKSTAGMSCNYDYQHDMNRRGATSPGVGFRCCSP